MKSRCFLLCALVAFGPLGCAAVSGMPVQDVPRLEGIAVDGDLADWADRGLQVALLADEEGRFCEPADLDAHLAIGWDQRGLLLAFKVRDDVAVEYPVAREAWMKDAIEIFMATGRGSSDYFSLGISPGRDPARAELRHSLRDWRPNPATQPVKPTAELARKTSDQGYTLEALLPWANLDIQPAPGRQFALQVYVDDSDDPAADRPERLSVKWYPRGESHLDTTAMHTLRLTGKPSPPANIAVVGRYENMEHAVFAFVALPEMAGREVEVRAESGPLLRGKLALEKGRAVARLATAMPPIGKPFRPLSAAVGGRTLGPVLIPDADQVRRRAFVDARFNFKRYVFSDARFPPCDFDDPDLVRKLIGPYRVETTFYDAGYRPVRIAPRRGLYGAVVEIIPEVGRTTRRFRTLWRDPDHVEGQDVLGHPDTDAESAAVMAGHRDAYPDLSDADGTFRPLDVDRQWWVGLKRKLYGTDPVWTKLFDCPTEIQGPPAPVLREGTDVEAGMKPGTAEKVDAVCRRWADDSDQAFAVCFARRGVIWLHKAYGTRDGKPMTVNTKSWMASITKILSGTIMMMMVDQGLVDLDDRVDKFIPALRGIEVKCPLTVRHLYTMANGLWDHWGDGLHDFEEIIADYYPHLEVGVQYRYNGAGLALGSKAIEHVSGESLPLFYKRHLLRPLGCEHTDVSDSGGGAMSAPLDMARIGQMLLNKGAYGKWRFFSEDTFQQMLPRDIGQALKPPADIPRFRGIGLGWTRGDIGFGQGSFGHGAASSAIFDIDPVNEMVVIITRNTAGRNWGKYYLECMAAIVQGLPDAKAP